MSNQIGQSNLKCLFPNFLLHKVWDVPQDFNNQLYDLAEKENDAAKVKDNQDPLSVGTSAVHFSHKRSCFLSNNPHSPIVRRLVLMADSMVREYLLSVYNYMHEGDISMTAMPILYRRKYNENTGMWCHAHPKFDIVCAYYPRVRLDSDCADYEFLSGKVRFYDPSGNGMRLWKNRNPNFVQNAWHSEEAVEGSMMVFEGHMQHDVTYFQGEDRMCIPINCNIDLPNSRKTIKSSSIINASAD